MPSTMSLIDPRHPLLRTWLFGPGADSAVHDAMSACGANVLILDLEDSTPPPLRDKARALAAGLFGRWRKAGSQVCVRINSLHEDGPLDLASVVPARPDFMRRTPSTTQKAQRRKRGTRAGWATAPKASSVWTTLRQFLQP